MSHCLENNVKYNCAFASSFDFNGNASHVLPLNIRMTLWYQWSESQIYYYLTFLSFINIVNYSDGFLNTKASSHPLDECHLLIFIFNY